MVLLVFDHYTIDEIKRELRREAEPVKIDPLLFDLLALFVHHPGEVLNRRQIIDSVWGGRVVSESGLTVAIARLRKVLGKARNGGNYLACLYGRGYCFLPVVEGLPESDGPHVRPVEMASRAPLVGRAEVVAQLMYYAQHALAGRGRLCLLAGEPGIGKTHVAEWLAQYARTQSTALVVWGRCQSDATQALWPIRQIVRGLAKCGLVPASMLDASETQRTPILGPLAAVSVPVFGRPAHDGNIDPGVLEALAYCVRDASRRRPLLLIVDDIQWADSASLRVLTYISDEIVRAPILLVCALRDGGCAIRGQREVSQLWNHRNCERIELRRLNAKDVTDYVQNCLGQDTQHRELSRVLFARSEGNPFFMVDLLSGLDTAQPHTLSPSRFALDAVRERLEDLPERTRYVLSAAAVIGHDFDIGLLSHIVQSKPELILDVLSEARVDQCVVRVPGAMGAFCFVHELIREVLYNELPLHERGQLHLRAGGALQNRLIGGGEAMHTQLAHQFLSAQPLGDVEVAIEYAQSAAMEAARLEAHTDARKLLERALEVLRFQVAPRPELRAELLLQLAMIECVAGEPAYAAHLAAATAIARRHRLGHLLVAACQWLSRRPDLSAHAEALSALEAANASLDADDLPRSSRV